MKTKNKITPNDTLSFKDYKYAKKLITKARFRSLTRQKKLFDFKVPFTNFSFRIYKKVYTNFFSNMNIGNEVGSIYGVRFVQTPKKMTNSHGLKSEVSKNKYIKSEDGNWWVETCETCPINCQQIFNHSLYCSKTGYKNRLKVRSSVLPPTAKAEGIRTQEL